jgi:hypothetical protein
MILMSRRRSRTAVRHQSPAAPAEKGCGAPLSPGVPAVPDLRLPRKSSLLPWILGGGFLVILLAVLFSRAGKVPLAPSVGGPPPVQAEVTDEQRLCERFAQLHNGGELAAAALLGRVPAVPDGPVSPEEANRLQADWFLREPIEISHVGPDRTPGARPAARFVLVTKGNVSAPALQERTPTGVVRSQRTMSNPDITVEVRDGKIYGVRPELHVGP